MPFLSSPCWFPGGVFKDTRFKTLLWIVNRPQILVRTSKTLQDRIQWLDFRASDSTDRYNKSRTAHVHLSLAMSSEAPGQAFSNNLLLAKKFSSPSSTSTMYPKTDQLHSTSSYYTPPPLRVSESLPVSKAIVQRQEKQTILARDR